MPAATVDDPLTLPRVQTPNPASTRPRPVVSVTTAPHGAEGEGFPVRRAFAGVDVQQLDPFLHMDQMGEVQYAPGEPKGTPWHPHRGFETVTYLIDGQLRHADSNGGGGLIGGGDIAVDDRRVGHPAHRDAARSPGRLRWPVPRIPAVGQPARPMPSSPRRATRTSPPPRSPCSPAADGGALLRLIAGDLGGHSGPGCYPHADHAGARDRRAGCRGDAALAVRTSTRWCTTSGAGGRSVPSGGRCWRASSPCSAPATR